MHSFVKRSNKKKKFLLIDLKSQEKAKGRKIIMLEW